jgi:hypothetical protein
VSEVGAHRGRGVQEPAFETFDRGVGVACLAGEEVGLYQGVDGRDGLPEPPFVVAIAPRVRVPLTVDPDVRQTVGCLRIRPGVVADRVVVVGVSGPVRRLTVEDGIRPAGQELVGSGHQLTAHLGPASEKAC